MLKFITTKKLIEYIIDYLNRGIVYNPTCIELAEWLKKRESVVIEESISEIQLYFSKAVDSFSITIFGAKKISKIEGADAVFRNNHIVLNNVKANAVVTVYLLKEKNETTDNPDIKA